MCCKPPNPSTDFGILPRSPSTKYQGVCIRLYQLVGKKNIILDLFKVSFYLLPLEITIKPPFGRICFTFCQESWASPSYLNKKGPYIKESYCSLSNLSTSWPPFGGDFMAVTEISYLTSWHWRISHLYPDFTYLNWFLDLFHQHYGNMVLLCKYDFSVKDSSIWINVLEKLAWGFSCNFASSLVLPVAHTHTPEILLKKKHLELQPRKETWSMKIDEHWSLNKSIFSYQIWIPYCLAFDIIW